MKLPKMKKLPSGNWRMQLQIEGERYSITDKDPKVVKQKAYQILAGFKAEKRSEFTVGDAIDKYIAFREPRLSPSTTRSYEAYRRLYLQPIMNINLNRLTQDDVDEAILEDEDSGISAKTIHNAHGLLTATLKKYRPSFHLQSDLPPIDRAEMPIPTEDELVEIWSEALSGKYNRDVEIAIVLAGWLGLRMSEILGLKYSDIDGDHINIRNAKVLGKNGDVIKGPKTKAGERRIRISENIKNLIGTGEGFIITCHRTTINRYFNAICERVSVPKYRLHDLRHFSASEALSFNIPNKYQMKRMGHSTEYMLQRVYQHVMRDKEDMFFDPLDDRMSQLFKNAHAASHEKIKGL